MQEIGDEGVSFRDIAGSIGRHLNVSVVSKSQAEAAKRFRFLTAFISTDNPASSELTHERLGWKPAEPGLLADLDQAPISKREQTGVTAHPAKIYNPKSLCPEAFAACACTSATVFSCLPIYLKGFTGVPATRTS